MAALIDLQSASTLLSALMGNDPRLLLVNAVAWLDPETLIQPHDDTDEFDDDTGDDLTIALHICRAYFPLVYAGARQAELQGMSEAAIARSLLNGMNAQLAVPMNGLDEVRFGPPITCYGVSLEMVEPEAIDAMPYVRLLPLFALFGLCAGGIEPDSVQTAALNTAKALIQSLTARAELVYQDMANLLLWMFSMSGNTAVDWTLEMLWESGIDSPDWSPDDVAFMNELNREAADILASAERALAVLENDLTLRETLARNITAILTELKKAKKGKSPHVNHNATRRTDADTTPLVRCLQWPERT